ncbi:MAG: phage portal protein [Lachnospiraceae bacterium]|nr:phage portal protein [Lachnospiraceae bacterium]
MADYKGINYLRHKLDKKRVRVDLRYKFYEMKNSALDFNISTPPQLQWWQSVIGWCAKSVDSLADRLVFRDFKNDNFNLNEIYEMNNPDTLFNAAIQEALIGSCSFIYITPGENGSVPRLQVIDGSDATGVIDQITGLLTEGYAVLERDDNDNPIVEAYLTPYNTRIIYKERRGEINYDYPHNVPYPLLVPIIYRPDAKRPFGHSRISRACMSITDSALRTIKRGEISAEFYSYPQKYVTGLDDDASTFDKWKASMSSMLSFENNSDGDNHVHVGQFTQQSMQPHLEQLKMFASLFAGETGLTLDDLGFATDNPSSAEAIKAAHENLRLTARKAQRTFGTGFLNAGYLARCLVDDYEYQRSQLYLTKAQWEPVFEPDYASLSLIGDGAIKINQAVPNYFDKNSLRDLTGIEPAEVEEVIND